MFSTIIDYDLADIDYNDDIVMVVAIFFVRFQNFEILSCILSSQ